VFLLIARWRHLVVYFALYAGLFSTCWALMQLLSAQFLYWWRDLTSVPEQRVTRGHSRCHFGFLWLRNTSVAGSIGRYPPALPRSALEFMHHAHSYQKQPPGEAPANIRRVVGLVIPVATRISQRRTFLGTGCASGPKSRLGALFAILLGRTQRE